jgi:hypothetical protein
MTTVWIAFILTAVALTVVGFGFLRYKGEYAVAVNKTAKFLFLMAIGTLTFPVLLPIVGVTVWIASYVVFVVAVTGILTMTAVSKARQIVFNR